MIWSTARGFSALLSHVFKSGATDIFLCDIVEKELIWYVMVIILQSVSIKYPWIDEDGTRRMIEDETLDVFHMWRILLCTLKIGASTTMGDCVYHQLLQVILNIQLLNTDKDRTRIVETLKWQLRQLKQHFVVLRTTRSRLAQDKLCNTS